MNLHDVGVLGWLLFVQSLPAKSMDLAFGEGKYGGLTRSRLIVMSQTSTILPSASLEGIFPLSKSFSQLPNHFPTFQSSSYRGDA